MPYTVEATYENGVLKLDLPLPLREHERVQVTIEPHPNWVKDSYGICGWRGDPEELRRLALAPDLELEDEP